MKTLLTIILLLSTLGTTAGPFDQPALKELATMTCPVPPRSVRITITLYEDWSLKLSGNSIAVAMAGLKNEYKYAEIFQDDKTRVLAVSTPAHGDNTYAYFDFTGTNFRLTNAFGKWNKNCR